MNQQEEYELSRAASDILNKDGELSIDDLQKLRSCTHVLPGLGAYAEWRMNIEFLLSLHRLNSSIVKMDRSSSRLMYVAIVVALAGVVATIYASSG